MTSKNARILRDTLFLIGFLVAFLGRKHIVIILLGIIMVVSGVVIQFRFHRCSHCGKLLGNTNGDYCPYCGQRADY